MAYDATAKPAYEPMNYPTAVGLSMPEAAAKVSDLAARAAAAADAYMVHRSEWTQLREELDAAWRDFMEARDRQDRP